MDSLLCRELEAMSGVVPADELRDAMTRIDGGAQRPVPGPIAKSCCGLSQARIGTQGEAQEQRRQEIGPRPLVPHVERRLAGEVLLRRRWQPASIGGEALVVKDGGGGLEDHLRAAEPDSPGEIDVV